MNDEGSKSKLITVSSERDLGIWVTSKPDFTLQCDKASAKGMQSLGLIKRTLIHPPDQRILFDIIQDIHSFTFGILCVNLESILSQKLY